jgi:hypothetical protein
MLHKHSIEYKFNSRRNYNLTTPCCNRSNKDGKFSTFVNLPETYGFCHSCGKKTVPPTIYKDEKGNEYIWDDVHKKFETFLNSFQNSNSAVNTLQNNKITIEKKLKFIPETTIWNYYYVNPENNLLSYLRKEYGNEKVNDAKKLYAIGSTADGGTVYWNINSDLKVQKAKVSYYNENGKRTNKFKVPYKNEDGYYSCLYGAHLLVDNLKNEKTVILVESEKTAIVGYILLSQYVWLAYGGINGLTNDKLNCLRGRNVLLVPDMSENAVSICYNKLFQLRYIGITSSVWDITEGKTDQELKNEGFYNCDLEDIFRGLARTEST